MWDFIMNASLWTLALYGVFEIMKNIIYMITCTNLKTDGIYVIVAARNQEKTIEGFIRSCVFRILYGKEDMIKKVIAVDLDSEDETFEILNNLEKDYECVQSMNWKECKELMENVKEN